MSTCQNGMKFMCMLLKLTRKYHVCLQFLDFGIFPYTNIAENLNISLISNRSLLYFEKILLNALS